MARSHDYQYCDVVMKGGITSGIVYPLAVCELSREYKFKNIGGTSAGAIAAAITAAAECGRRSGQTSSFDIVAEVPKQLGRNDLLLRLFQPSPSTLHTFSVALAAIRALTKIGKIVRTSMALIRAYWLSALAGAGIGAITPIVLFICFRGSAVPYATLGLLWAFLCAGAAVGWTAAKDALTCLTSNGFGLCSGFDRVAGAGEPPLTNWLHAQIQAASGRNVTADPLTFGDLWNAGPYPEESLHTDRMINLQVVTTNLTQGRPFTIPFETNNFYFDEQEFAGLFPQAVADWLRDHQRQQERHPRARTAEGKTLCPLPLAKDVPVLVAARMSLSFPILLSAVPLYAVDYTLKQNQVPPEKPVVAERCWFSDGGISSNFPIHFFDSPLPRWPTFGIDLKAPHPDHSENESDFVWLPKKPGSGSQISWNQFDSGSDADRLLGFFRAISNTMQNWHDNIQATAPGYRDRIVHVSLRPTEGGLNLTMPRPLLELLSDRGRRAGELLNSEFDFPSHIWARYRLTMCALQEYLDRLRESWTNPVPQDELGWDYIRGQEDVAHYRPSDPSELKKLIQSLYRALQELNQVSEAWYKQSPHGESFCDDSPRPQANLRGQPRF